MRLDLLLLSAKGQNEEHVLGIQTVLFAKLTYVRNAIFGSSGRANRNMRAKMETRMLNTVIDLDS